MDIEIAKAVQEYGWYVLNISDAEPPFLYTIGLMETFKHPEFILFGLEADNAYALLTGLVEDLRKGRRYSENGVYTVELDGNKHQVGFRRVHATKHALYLGYAMGFMTTIERPGELEAMQAFWPDREGRFPFEAGCDLEVFTLQPRLDISLTKRELRQWERRWE